MINLDRYTGAVLWFDAKRGYGFIEWSKNGVKQKDMFCHYSDIVKDGYKALVKMDRVSFSIGKNHNGDPKAIEIRLE